MAKNDDLKKIAMVVAAGLLLFGGVAYASVLLSTDNNGNGVADIWDWLKGTGGGGKGSGSGPGATPPPNASAKIIVDKNNTLGTPTLPPGTAGVIITGLDMSTVYTKDQAVSKGMYLDRPGTEITETVRLKVVGTTAYNVVINFDLLEGSVDSGLLRHTPNGVVRTQETAVRDRLDPGEYAIALKGRAPALSPGKNWHLGRVIVSAAGATPQYQPNWRDDNPLKDKWMALAYPDIYTDFPDGSLYTSIEPIVSKDGVALKFKMSAIGFQKEITSAVIHEVTYSGKYAVVYVGNIPACSTGEQGLTFLPNPLGLPCFFLGGTESTLFIPAVNLVSTSPNEVLFKIDAMGVRSSGTNTTAFTPNDPTLMSVAGTTSLVDLNKDTSDTAARVNIKGQIVGGKAWTSTAEYFSVMGVQGFAGFFSAGMASGGHPEAQWFK